MGTNQVVDHRRKVTQAAALACSGGARLSTHHYFPPIHQPKYQSSNESTVVKQNKIKYWRDNLNIYSRSELKDAKLVKRTLLFASDTSRSLVEWCTVVREHIEQNKLALTIEQEHQAKGVRLRNKA